MSKIRKIDSTGEKSEVALKQDGELTQDGFFSCESQSQSQLSQISPQTKALGNYLVSCSVVNSNWHSISTRKIRKYTVYLHDFVQLRLNDGLYADWHQKEIVVEEKIGKMEKTTVCVTLSTLISKLNDEKNGKSIWLKLSNSDITHPFVQEFLQKFRNFINRLTFGRVGILEINDPLYSMAVWNIISTQLPRLEFLNFEKTPLPSRINGRLTPVMGNKTLLKNLKTLKFSPRYSFPYSINLQLLKAAENLEKIYNVPLSHIHAYKMKKRVNIIKSVVYDQSPLLVSSANISRLQKLAHFSPELKELTINSTFPARQDANILLANCLTVFNQLLLSSKDTLEKLSIQTSEYFGRLDFPQLQNLKFIQFTDNPETTRSTLEIESGSKFKQNFNVNQIFPNLTHVEVIIFINESDLYFQPRVLDLYFPLETFHSTACFQNVEHLKLTKIMAVEAVKRMSFLFPRIKTLDITTDGSILHRLFPIIWENWSNLEVITLKVLFCSRSMNRVQNLDEVITGLHVEDIFSLQKNSDQIIPPRNYSILNMTNLKKMNVVLLHCTCLPIRQIISLFSDVSGTHGFQKVPGLEVLLALHERTGRREDFHRALAPIIPFVHFILHFRETFVQSFEYTTNQ